MTPGTPPTQNRSSPNGDDVAPDVATRLAAVRARIDEAAEAAGRDGAAVTLVAVSKMHPVEDIAAAISAGHRVFGENRVQEATAKYPGLKESCPDLRLHLIGPLQTNKARDAVRLFDVIESLDRPKLARALAKEMAREGRRPACFVQVNTGEELQKTGVFPEEADDLIALARDELDLPVEGLMCIPPMDEEPALHFALLRAIAERNGVPLLSMGMTADFETAIRLGATHVRIGTAVFGVRSNGGDAHPVT
jgi:pyridoxal phosphate enzyme (YggS family)